MSKGKPKSYFSSGLAKCLQFIIYLSSLSIIILFLFYNWLFTLLFIGFSAFAADVITSKITGFSVKEIKLDKALKELSTTISALVIVLIFLIGVISFEPLTPYQSCLNSKERYRGVSDEIHELQCRRDYDRK